MKLTNHWRCLRSESNPCKKKTINLCRGLSRMRHLCSQWSKTSSRSWTTRMTLNFLLRIKRSNSRRRTKSSSVTRMSNTDMRTSSNSLSTSLEPLPSRVRNRRRSYFRQKSRSDNSHKPLSRIWSKKLKRKMPKSRYSKRWLSLQTSKSRRKTLIWRGSRNDCKGLMMAMQDQTMEEVEEAMTPHLDIHDWVMTWCSQEEMYSRSKTQFRRERPSWKKLETTNPNINLTNNLGKRPSSRNGRKQSSWIRYSKRRETYIVRRDSLRGKKTNTVTTWIRFRIHSWRICQVELEASLVDLAPVHLTSAMQWVHCQIWNSRNVKASKQNYFKPIQTQ